VTILVAAAFIGAPVLGSECTYQCYSDSINIRTTIDTDCENGCSPDALCNNWYSFASDCVSDSTGVRIQWFAGVLYPERSINGDSCPSYLELQLVGETINAGSLCISGCCVEHDVYTQVTSYSVTVRGVYVATSDAFYAEVSGDCMNGAVVWSLRDNYFTFGDETSDTVDVIYHNRETNSLCAYTLEES
jgi:hypothetical protein